METKKKLIFSHKCDYCNRELIFNGKDSDSYVINADIPTNIGDTVNNCLLRESYVNEVSEGGQNLNIECYKNMDKTNFYMQYKGSSFKGFLIKNE